MRQISETTDPSIRTSVTATHKPVLRRVIALGTTLAVAGTAACGSNAQTAPDRLANKAGYSVNAQLHLGGIALRVFKFASKPAAHQIREGQLEQGAASITEGGLNISANDYAVPNPVAWKTISVNKDGDFYQATAVTDTEKGLPAPTLAHGLPTRTPYLKGLGLAVNNESITVDSIRGTLMIESAPDLQSGVYSVEPTGDQMQVTETILAQASAEMDKMADRFLPPVN